MKKWLLLLSTFFFLLSDTSFAKTPFPEPKGFVNDFAEIISENTEAKISNLIEEIKNKTSSEVAVVTIQSLEGSDPNDYAVELGRSWGVGTKERDDGVIFLIAVQDRKTYIATGYGVEGYITDAQAFWITDQIVVPFFKQGDFDNGILAGVEKIKEALVDLIPLPEKNTTSDFFTSEKFFRMFVSFFPFIFLFIFIWVGSVLGRSKRWWPGGIIGAIISIILILVFSITFFILIPLTLFGFLFDYLVSNNYRKGKNRWWSGGGSRGWGGGNDFGGGSSSGFSGGSFGGGGGGSSW